MLVSGLVILAACSPPVERPTGWARAYQDVTDTFIKSDFDRALTFSDPIVSTSPTNAYTDKALVLRAVIYAGEVKAYKELEDAYTKGIQAAKSPGARSDFERVRTDYREYAAKAALGLAEAALKVTQGGSLPKDLAFEATYPSVEGPTVVKELDRVREGGALSADDQEGAVRDAVRKGVDDVLATGGTANAAAQLVGGTGAGVAGFSFLIELDFLKGRRRLQGRRVEALLHYA